MSKAVIIVESPAKAKTIKKFLNAQYTVKASMGHVRDLPKSRLGVDIEDNFTPKYIVVKGKSGIVSELKEAVEKAKEVYVATDPDREGEAIAWHLLHLLKLETTGRRIELREITKDAVKQALVNAHSINQDKVNAQQARRILDRLVGYKLSPLLWKKVQGGLSAGRVQSVAVRLISDREREIQGFKPEEYWSITALLGKDNQFFSAILHKEKDEKISIPNEHIVKSILTNIQDADFIVESIQIRERKEQSSPPFITSTLQQEASRKLGFRVARTMKVAQQLYEGLDLGEEGSTGLITYMRTDSTRIAPYALEEAREYILKRFEPSYSLPKQFKISEAAQDAHEAIRPASVFREPETITSYLNKDQYKLYKLIWDRFVASQMSPCIKDVKTVLIKAKDYQWKAVGSWVKFPGFTIIYEEGKDIEKDKETEGESEGKTVIPPLNEGEFLSCKEFTPKQHFTQPPPRYSEATLVKALEEKGIGRPSTYAPIIETIQHRGYVTQDNKRFHPTELGLIVTDLLIQHFPNVLDIDFTAGMETKLDKIEEGGLDWIGVLREFYTPFDESLAKAKDEMQKVEVKPEETGETCNACGKPMVVKRGRFGKFVACSGFPNCKNTKKLLKGTGLHCPLEGCGGEVVELRSKKGKAFYGCSKFPACEFRSWNMPTNEKCPSCSSTLVARRGRGDIERLICEKEGCGYAISRKVTQPVQLAKEEVKI